MCFFSVPGSFAQYVTIGETRFLAHNGYLFYKNNRYNGTVYWQCRGYKHFGCSARVTTKNDIMKATKGMHNHSPLI